MYELSDSGHTALARLFSPMVLWTVSFAALALAVWIVGADKAPPVVLWTIAFFWLAVAGDLGAADLQGVSIADGLLGEYRDIAILYSLAALLALAGGMHAGGIFGRLTFGDTAARDRVSTRARAPLDLHKLVVCYIISFLFSAGVSAVAWSVPALTQPLLAFALIEYVFLFLIAAIVFETEQGYFWLLLVVAVSMGAGLVSYWSSYKEPIFVVILALLSVRKKMTVVHWAIGLAGFAALVWMSLVWTAIKSEYRADIVQLPIAEKVDWLLDQYLYEPLDYTRVGQKLLERIGYTELFSVILAEDSYGGLPTDVHFYGAAVEHILTPRIIFSDKPELNDSQITSQLVHRQISSGTSIGVGFVAQAYVDFGFPGFLVMLSVIGMMLGYGNHYFMTRRDSLIVRQAFSVAVLFI
jgi:hypothetical protein